MNMIEERDLLQVGCNILLNAFCKTFALVTFKLLACNVFVELYLAFTNTTNNFVRHFGNLLSFLTLETIFH